MQRNGSMAWCLVPGPQVRLRLLDANLARGTWGTRPSFGWCGRPLVPHPDPSFRLGRKLDHHQRFIKIPLKSA